MSEKNINQIDMNLIKNIRKLQKERDEIAGKFYQLSEKEKRNISPKIIELNDQIEELEKQINPTKEEVFDFLLECFYDVMKQEGRKYWGKIPEYEKENVIKDVIAFFIETRKFKE